ncbi:TetR/AcrR family transcriptional regulator [Actinoallomurus purpureus]|uniref:TetR/AcrR family transcriptional regulator n=1 Tax=Actinoallomurus purpureus TaxID=478114 RepID=UPI002091E909|nr:TetR/AcrR family transcriptional regulator [Actinoallomurus purpureus]MCO6003562.1 TetR/AcrR family transcriptional regulator [Actinoallomurus purpureus]
MTKSGSPASASAEHKLTAPGRRTRERIVQAAADLMFRQGVAGTSIPEIQQAAGVSASQIYHYFGDKRGLVRAVIDHQTEASLDGQRPILDHLDSFEALRAWCDAAVANQERRQCEGGCEIGSLASELVETDDATRADLVEAFERWERPIREGLARMQKRGELSADADVHDLATMMLAAIQGGLLLTQIRRSTHPFKTATDAALAHIETFAGR